MTQQQRDIKRKLAVLRHAEESGNVALTARRFGISRQCYYKWKHAYEERGEEGLINKKPCPENVTPRTPIEVEEKVIHLRRTYHFGPVGIAWYLERYHGITISSNGVYCVLKRFGLSRLPANCRKRSIASLSYEKQVPGHHVQVDVKFLQFKGADGRKVKRYQFTAIDDATRIRALRIYDRHNQQSAVDFINEVVARFPFRIHTIRTDNGHDFQAKFHWHIEDLGMRHVYIRPRSPNLNCKVERSHLTDQLEFYQLLDYTDDVDLREVLLLTAVHSTASYGPSAPDRPFGVMTARRSGAVSVNRCCVASCLTAQTRAIIHVCCVHARRKTTPVVGRCSRASRPRCWAVECLTEVVSRRVLLLTATLAGGGLERQLTLLATHLPSCWQPAIWSSDGGPFVEVLRHSGVGLRIERRRARFDPLPFVSLARLIVTTRPDVVHAWHWLPNAVAAPVCRLVGVPLVDGTIRMGRRNRAFGRPRRSLMYLANVVVANGQAGLQAWHVPPARGRVVYNAFDPMRLEAPQGLPNARAPRPLADGRPFTVVMTGRMHPRKDHGSVISAARLLASRSAPSAWRFLLIGDGPKRRELQIQAADLVTAGVVEFASPGLEVLPLVGTADVGVLMTNDATHAEGCSNSIMEYMASGLAVVCCDSGGNKELVADGVNGYLVPPGDAADLARRLEQLRADPEARSRMGAAGNARLLREFSLARMIDAYVGIYDDCLGTTRDLPAGTP